MYTAHVNLFDPNPYQPRQEINPTALRELADNILALKPTRPHTCGLLQPPLARVVGPAGTDVTHVAITNFAETAPTDITVWLDNTNYRLQLALGHRRHAAFALLAPTDPDYLYLPFELAPLTDEDMFQAALSENLARADLNPIEIAQSMLRYRDEFNKSSKEIGQLFGLSDSAVRNLIRLLDLPEAPRKALAEGTMSQGTARALLSLYAIPEATRQCFTTFYHNEYGRTEKTIVEAAINGEIASNIDEMITKLVASNSRRLKDLRWSLTDIFPEEEGIEHPDCETCPFHVIRQKEHYCAKSACMIAKLRHWETQQLLAASEATGLPINKTVNKADFNYGDRKAALAQAQAIHCPNLCLRFNDHIYGRNNAGYEHCTVPGHPGAELMCSKLEQHCTCIQATKAKITLAKEETIKKIDADPKSRLVVPPLQDEPPATVSQQDLKAINRQIREQKAQNREEVKAIRQEAAKRFYWALSTNHLRTWKELLNTIYGFSTNETTIEDMLLSVSEYMVDRKLQYESEGLTNPDLNNRSLNIWLKTLGLDPLEPAVPVSTETPAPLTIQLDSSGSPTHFNGKPLIEVFASNDADLILETCIHEWTADAQNNIYCEHCGETFDNVVSNHS